MKLVARLNDVWSIYDIDGNIVPLPNEPLICPVCNGSLILHDFRAYSNPAIQHCFCDVHLKRKVCGLWLTFGLPASKELVEMLRKSKYHAKTLRWELKDIYREMDPKIIERLEKLGYW